MSKRTQLRICLAINSIFWSGMCFFVAALAAVAPQLSVPSKAAACLIAFAGGCAIVAAARHDQTSGLVEELIPE